MTTLYTPHQKIGLALLLVILAIGFIIAGHGDMNNIINGTLTN